MSRTASPHVTTCSFCSLPNTKLCDFVVAAAEPGKDATWCDRRLCGRCATQIDLDIDYCPYHSPKTKGEIA